MSTMDPRAFDEAVDELELGHVPSVGELEARYVESLERSLERRRRRRPWADLAWAAAGGLLIAGAVIVGLLL